MPIAILKANESVTIGDNISVTAVDLNPGDQIKIWITAPDKLKIVSPPVFKYKITKGNYNIEDMKYVLIKEALKETNDNYAKAACLLGVTARGLHNVLEKYRGMGLDVPPKRKIRRPRKTNKK